MLMSTTSQLASRVWQPVADLARSADTRLTRTAAHNAATALASRSARRLEDARTLRDLRRIGLPDDADRRDPHPARARGAAARLPR